MELSWSFYNYSVNNMTTEIKREKHIVDATGLSIGRVATQVAILLRGKHKPSYQPHIDVGDFVTVTNLSKMRITGKKDDQKVYHRNTGYPGGIRTESFQNLRVENPEKLMKMTVRKMLPATKLRSGMLKRLTVQ